MTVLGPHQPYWKIVARETRDCPGFMLSQPPFQIVGMTDVIFSSVAVKHVGPKGQRQSFDKLRTNGMLGAIC